jgi:uncharacterized protein
MNPARNWRETPQRYRLEAAKCKGCGKVHFPPRLVCDSCHGRAFESLRLPDDGTVETWTVIRVAPAGFGDQVPYALGVIKLSNGVRIMAQIVDLNPDELKIGLPVKLEFRKIQSDGERGIHGYGYKAVPA